MYIDNIGTTKRPRAQGYLFYVLRLFREREARRTRVRQHLILPSAMPRNLEGVGRYVFIKTLYETLTLHVNVSLIAYQFLWFINI